MEAVKLPGPVVIGGSGGSGTRLVAQILIDAGFYMGADFNPPLDNLWVTLLFRRPVWRYRMHVQNPDRIRFAWKTLEKAMTGRLSPTPRELGLILQASLEHLTQELWPGWSVRRMVRREFPFVVRRLVSLLSSRRIDRSGYVGWGWKEPNTVFYLEHVEQHFKRFKYIHVMRHGVDMALRPKQRQLYNWGHILGFPIEERVVAASPPAALAFWVKLNQYAFDVSKEWQNAQLYTVRLEELCLAPYIEVKKLLDFLEVTVDEATFNHLCSLPKLPTSAGQYKDCDLSIFNPDDLSAVTAMGYSLQDD